MDSHGKKINGSFLWPTQITRRPTNTDSIQWSEISTQIRKKSMRTHAFLHPTCTPASSCVFFSSKISTFFPHKTCRAALRHHLGRAQRQRRCADGGGRQRRCAVPPLHAHGANPNPRRRVCRPRQRWPRRAEPVMNLDLAREMVRITSAGRRVITGSCLIPRH